MNDANSVTVREQELKPWHAGGCGFHNTKGRFHIHLKIIKRSFVIWMRSVSSCQHTKRMNNKKHSNMQPAVVTFSSTPLR
jgi:hypothetical protein